MKYKRCGKCGFNRSIDSRYGWKGRPPRARVCNYCTKARTRGKTRAVRVLETYGLTLAEVAKVLEEQDGLCAICDGKRPGNLDIDHSHKTNVVRGLLCKRCNRRLLPAALDDPTILRSAIDYLLDPPAVRALGERRVPDGSSQA